MIRQYSPLIKNAFKDIAEVEIGNQQFCIYFEKSDIKLFVERASSLWVVHEDGREIKDYSEEQVKEHAPTCVVSKHRRMYVSFEYISDVRKAALQLKTCIVTLKEMNNVGDEQVIMK